MEESRSSGSHIKRGCPIRGERHDGSTRAGLQRHDATAPRPSRIRDPRREGGPGVPPKATQVPIPFTLKDLQPRRDTNNPKDYMPGCLHRVGMKSGTQRSQKALRASQRKRRKAGTWREAFPALRALDRVRSRILGGSRGRSSRAALGSRPESGRPDERVGRAPSVPSVGLCALVCSLCPRFPVGLEPAGAVWQTGGWC